MDTTLLLILAATIVEAHHQPAPNVPEGSSVSHVKTCSLPKEHAICERDTGSEERTTETPDPWGNRPSKDRSSYFYYNCDTGVCERFGLYDEGCGGNDNHFKSLEDCQKHCAGVVCDVCSLPYKVGQSTRQHSYLKRYSYNSKTGACEQFLFNGHGGNHNNFKTRQACEDKCVAGASGPLHVTLVESGCITDWLGLGKTYCFRGDPVMLRCEFSGGSGDVHVQLVRKVWWGETIVPGTGPWQFAFDPYHPDLGRGGYFCRVTDQSLNVTAESSVVELESPCAHMCNRIYRPVCGSDGKWYDNYCQFAIGKCENPDLIRAPCQRSHHGLLPGKVAF